MKYKTLFRLLMKAIGVLLFAQGLPQSVAMIAWMFQSATGTSTTFPSPYFQIAVAVLQPALGVYLFFGGKWIVNLAIPSNRPYCPECAYDLTGAPVGRCPECGTVFRWEDVRPKIEDRSPKIEKGD